jgi:hypothetical protein
MVQEQVTEKAVASKVKNEDVENSKMDTSTTPAVEIDLTQPEEIAKMDTEVQPVTSLNHNEYKKKVTFVDQVERSTHRVNNNEMQTVTLSTQNSESSDTDMYEVSTDNGKVSVSLQNFTEFLQSQVLQGKDNDQIRGNKTVGNNRQKAQNRQSYETAPTPINGKIKSLEA